MIPDLDSEQRQRLAEAYKARRRERVHVAAPTGALAVGAICPQCGANALNGCAHYLPAEPVVHASVDSAPRGARFYQRRPFWGQV